MQSANVLFLDAYQVMKICRCGQTKAYKIIKKLGEELENEGFMRPPSGKIQKLRFCEKFCISVADCERVLDYEEIL